MTAKLTVAIVGNPNCGKTTLFNLLTGSQQKVGNWAGVTVAKKTGVMQHKDQQIAVVDLPGIYSLSVATATGSIDERIACRYLLSGKADVIINIVDAANLKRHLYLTLQLLEMGIPCILAVNMLDMAEKQQIHVDCAALAAELGCPVIALVSTRGVGVEALKDIILKPRKWRKNTTWGQHLPPSVHDAINLLIPQIIQSNISVDAKYQRWLAMRLLEKDALALEWVGNTDLTALVNQKILQIERDGQEDSDIILADCRYEKISALVQCCVNSQRQIPHRLTKLLDRVTLHRWFGIPIFLLVMYLIFEFSMSIGGLLQPLFDLSSAALLVDGVQYLGQTMGLPVWLIAIFAHGIGMGVNTVVNFIPQIGLLFLALSFLEDSGYMARAAFVMDRLMQAVGLPGKSFIPLIVGFGCNVPAIMATRTLESHRDRILTTMMSPFMSCGARLAIFVVFGALFFPHHAGLLIFLLYIIGIVAAMLTGFLLKSTLLNGEAAPFILEMPDYHVPTWKNLWLLTWQRLKGFVIRAGKVIIPVCVIVGSLNTIETNGHVATEGSPQSVLAVASQAVTPIFAPMGITEQNWPATVGLLTGVLAKEVVVGTLNTLYAQDAGDSFNADSFHLWAELKAAVIVTLSGFKELFTATELNPFTATMADPDISKVALGQMAIAFGGTAAAFSYLLFVLLYIPCISTMGVMSREIGSRWAVLSLFWSISVAYSIAVLSFQVATFMQHPFAASVWIVSLALWQFAWWAALKIKSKQLVACYP